MVQALPFTENCRFIRRSNWSDEVLECWALLDPILHHSTTPLLQSSVVARQNIFRPQFHLLAQTIHGRVDDFELEMLHAIFDKFIDTAAHIVDRAKNMAVPRGLPAIDVALVGLAAGFERSHR